MEIIVKHRKDLDKGYGWEVHISIQAELSDGEFITIPPGFITDFASVPQKFWSIIPSIGTYNAASIMHDYLYSIGYKNRKFCDKEFLYWLNTISPNKRFRNKIMYIAVRLFGKKEFK